LHKTSFLGISKKFPSGKTRELGRLKMMKKMHTLALKKKRVLMQEIT
jgi:hypothetical protein